MSLKEGLQASTRMVEEEGESCGGRRSNKRFWHWSINDSLLWR